MATAWEIDGTRSIQDVENPSITTKWAVADATSYLDAVNAMALVLPTTFTFPSGRVAFLNGFPSVESPAEGDVLYLFTAEYTAKTDPEFNELEYEFEVSAPIGRLFQAISTRRYSKAGVEAANYGAAIGVQYDGTVAGLEQPSPVSTFRITKHWPVNSITLGYQTALEDLIGHVNSALYQGRAAGTVRFLGARGRHSGDKFPITYEFGFRPNDPPFQLDGVQVSGQVKGWELYDYVYEFEADSSAKKLVSKLRSVNIHQLYQTSSFAGLGI